ncbi:calcium-translocating P-type ATPase, SERCA-type [Hazenella sp. IB182353]|uniref:calcium-translocating P-type ATPase, SERCA-type n=1 Tax=Polycladospora coralii TaxID=2771432 RepID=UPI001746BBFF|nr:calcium-translocating P-type ATPase, SERCA-type [Polycladospora coralii]MBS7530325.1 calcium-translocating P-type ATPase, SERCA-type [Polycladospora coralii]
MANTARWVDWEAEKVAAHFRVNPSTGLDDEDVRIRAKQAGPNQIVEGQKKSMVGIFVDQFKDFMVLILMVATLISGILGEYTDAIAIIAIVILNAILGFAQEIKAERSLSALKKLSAPTAKVFRSGKWERCDAASLVPGDVIYLESGMRIPADVRLIQTENCYVEESALTGESVPVNKTDEVIIQSHVALGDQKNMGFMGTSVIQGTAVAIVVQTGMATEMGKIAHLIETTEQMETPLQRRLAQLGKVLIGVSLILTALVVVTGILHGHDAYKMFLAGVSLAVAAIPEGLPAIVTVALAMGVQRMIRRRAIVRKLPSVETLGCATVVCSDKTGTLTQNKMTVTHIWSDGHRYEVTGSGFEPKGSFLCDQQAIQVQNHFSLARLLEVAGNCNNASLHAGGRVDGDPTEGALLVAAAKAGLKQKYQRMKEIPFDSTRKRMSVVVENNEGKRYVYCKGAPDILLSRCTHVSYKGKITPLTTNLKEQIMAENEQMAENALRNLGFAYRELESYEKMDRDTALERKLIFVGLAGMIDPPRDEVREAIQTCHQAGIKTVMITGDHQTTALAIAKQLGMLQSKGKTITGRDLDDMTDEELASHISQIDVFARVTPEHKLRIVKAFQHAGHVVAMTGDGVNDAPAIKAADIGVAMGIAGTDVSKEAASLILVDDNFSTIVSAIEEGRSIYDNIRKFISYLLASNVGEILIMFFAMLAGLPLPLVPIQILWVNLVTDGLPAMALGVDPAEEKTMNRLPRNSKESIFARGIGWKIVTRGILIGVCSLAAFWITYSEAPHDLVRAQTVAFATLVFAQLIYVFDCRSVGTIFHRNPFSNVPLVLAVISSAALLIGVMYYEPLQPLFHTVALGVREWILVGVTSFLPVLVAGLIDQLRPKNRIQLTKQNKEAPIS